MNPRPPVRTSPLATALLWLLAFVAAMAYARLIPPMQSPDETSHIARAYLVSKGQWLLAEPEPQMRELVARYPDIPEVPGFIDRMLAHGGRTGGGIDLGLLDYVDAYRAWPGKPARKYTPEETQRLAQMPWRGREVYYPMPGTGYYLPAIYAPHALGLWAGRTLKLPMGPSYQLARGAALLASLLLLWAAFRLLRPSPLALALLLLPMSLFQVLSPTLDGLTTALAVLCTSIFLRLMTHGGAPGRRLSVTLTLGVLLLATTRTHLIVLLALPWVLAWRCRSRLNAVLAAAVTAAALAWTLFALTTGNDVLVPRAYSAASILLYYAQHPLDFFGVLFATVGDPNVFTFYERSFVGILGSLDVPLPLASYAWLWGGLALCALASVSLPSSSRDGQARAVLGAAAVAATLLIFLALLATWTPHPAHQVNGVQGRYFIVPALLLAYLLSGQSDYPSRWQALVGRLLVAAFGAAALVALTQALLTRYH